MSEIISAEVEASIEYGGLVWLKSPRSDSVEFRATQSGTGNFRVYQYPEGESHSSGLWLWMVEFNALVGPEFYPSVLEMRAGKIVETRDEAMQACIESKNRLIEDIKMLGLALDIGDYATAFNAGQDELARKIVAVLP